MVRIDARLAIGGTIMIIAGIALSIHSTIEHCRYTIQARVDARYEQ